MDERTAGEDRPRDARDEGEAQRTGGSADAGGGGTGLDREMRRQLREEGEDPEGSRDEGQ